VVTLLRQHKDFSIDAIYPNESGSYRAIGYRIIKCRKPESIAVARDQLAAAMVPPHPKQLVMELTRLWSLTAHKSHSDQTLDLLLEAFASKLEDYPADAVIETLREWPENNKWWPTWVELKTRIEKKCRHRRLLLTALTKATEVINDRAL
jgi:hypothetical protein